MRTDQYDVLILGGGNAGIGVTVATRAAGLSVAMVEPRELGGTCPNRGCTPKKVLVAACATVMNLQTIVSRRLSPADISRLPTPMRPPAEPNSPPPPSSCAEAAASAPPGKRSSRACTVSAGPSVARKSRMIPTARSATGRATPTLPTTRSTSSSTTDGGQSVACSSSHGSTTDPISAAACSTSRAPGPRAPRTPRWTGAPSR